ncbi:MAG: SpoIIE family protein phosphatase [Ruminococcus sp.]|jgi:sigma-B regulation protein RsbU (phosphoserine phosphatase)|nr:SpoIIE family protein phosphatase [Ruminococcus sp.]
MNSRKIRKIRSKILAVILVTALIPLIGLGAASVALLSGMRTSAVNTNNELGTTASDDSATALRTQIESDLTARAAAIADSVDAKLLQIENQTRVNAKYAEKLYANPENYAPRPLNYLQPNEIGSTVAHIRTAASVNYEDALPEISLLGNAADVLDEFLVTGISVNANYIGTETGIFVTVDTNSSGPNRKDYDPRTRGWYIGAKDTGTLFWTDIFADASGRGASISCAMPIYVGGKLMGVAGTGATLERISDIVRGASIGENGWAFLLNQRGEVVITPHSALVMDDEGNLTGENYLQSNDTSVRLLAESMVFGQSGVRQINLAGQEVIVAFAPLERTGWSIGAVIPNTEAIAPVTAMQKDINGLITESEKAVETYMTTAITVVVIAVVLALVLSLILSFRFSSTISKPISILTEEAGEIGKGNLDNTITLMTGDELEELAHAFNLMTSELKVYIKDFEKVTADKERIATELNVATNIQAGMLPHIFPPYPDRKEFDLYGSMQPAKEVGGDFYDFFLADEKTLAVVIADVSGKGVPAALFMVIAKTLLKNNAQMDKSPKQVFDEVNNVLCENNEGGMFVTAFMGYLDVYTGEFNYVNAGHNPPCIQRAETGNWEFLPCKPGFVLAGMEDISYKPQSTTLGKGDKLYLYTDGVTEATDQVEDLYGEKRLITTLNAHKDDNIIRLINSIKDDIRDFARGAEQADDITMLALEYFGQVEEEG